MSSPEPRVSRYALDAILASCALVLASPVLLMAAIGIRLSSPGPIIYRARRIARDRRRWAATPSDSAGESERRQPGYGGREFTIYKLRTMHVQPHRSARPITALHDDRVFPFGAFLRVTKIDELPQLLNVIRGEMALVGPRPEAPEIVRGHYSATHLETLRVPPGLTSPGSIYYYTHGEATLEGDDATSRYTEDLLPVKLEIDRRYVRRATLVSDVLVLLRTVVVVVARAFGKREFPISDDLIKLPNDGAFDTNRQQPGTRE